MIADFLFEISSDGELEQVLPLIKSLISSNKNIEILFSSPSVSKRVESLSLEFKENLSIYCLPLLNFGPALLGGDNFKRWATANQVVLCRYDFFPELISYLSHSKRSFIVSATLKNRYHLWESKKLKYFLTRWYWRAIYSFFTNVIPATKIDECFFKTYFTQCTTYENFDFRVLQVEDRLNHASSVLEEFDYYDGFLNYLENFQKDKRIIIGSSWDSELESLKSQKFQKMIKSGHYHLLIAPHSLDFDKVNEMIDQISKIAPTISLYRIKKDMNKLQCDQMFLEATKKPGIIFSTIPRILCEHYHLYQHAFIGGGWGRSIHSVLEPFVSGTFVYCGPKIHRSTEFDSVFQWVPDEIKFLEKPEDLFSSLIEKKVDKNVRTALFKRFEVMYNQFLTLFLDENNDR